MSDHHLANNIHANRRIGGAHRRRNVNPDLALRRVRPQGVIQETLNARAAAAPCCAHRPGAD
jgi:hypothetical protein